jgi:HSP20 family protein
MSELSTWKDREIDRMRKEMNHLIHQFWSDFGMGLWPEEPETVPTIDVSETPDRIVLRAELPGMSPKDVEVTVGESSVTIKGERREEGHEKNAFFYRAERRMGSFTRTLRLPCRVKVEEVEASFRDGILKIAMPKCETPNQPATRIKIE